MLVNKKLDKYPHYFILVFMDAVIQKIKDIKSHPNADLLEIAVVLGFECIVKRDLYKVGDIICFIFPDTVLPDKPWASFYKSKSGRVKSIKLRGVWSQGIIEKLETVEYSGPIEIGREISTDIGVIHYEAPQPQELNAKGRLPFGIPKTDEDRAEQIEDLPWGDLVDVSLKIDGQSCSFYWYVDYENIEHNGVLGRTLEYKRDSWNNYTQNQANYDAINKISAYCRQNNINGLCIRGESFGKGIQKASHNPHSKPNLGWAAFSTYLIDQHECARKGHPLYIFDIADAMGLPTVPLIEKDVPLTKELIEKYAFGIDSLHGNPFEGVVINYSKGSFKVINRKYDSLK